MAGYPSAAAYQSAGSMVPGFTPQEHEYYQQLFVQADQGRVGFLDGLTAANFLTRSGVPQDTLHRIWEIADANAQGTLTMEKFYVACRLVAHVQAGMAPTAQLASVEPRMLPDFQGVQRQRQPSETSSVPGSPSPSALGAHSEHSELQPVIAGHEEQVRRAAQAVRQASRSPAPRVFTRKQWAPSQREKRKYASLFKRVDWDADGYVQGSEASDLLERSRLDRRVLGVAWEHADQDRDGKLSFREFVCLVHIVTCVLRGAPLPQQHESLPVELTTALANLESCDVLVAEREASRSRSTSPFPSGPTSPLAWGTPRHGASGSMWGTGDELGAGFDTAARSDDRKAAAADPFGTSGFADSGFGDSSGMLDSSAFDSKGKKDKKSKSKKGEDPFGTADTALDTAWGSAGGFGGEPGLGRDPFGMGMAADPPRGGSRGRSLRTSEDEAHLMATAAQFESILAADREVTRQLRREVDELRDEIGRLQSVRSQLEQEAHQDRQEEARVASQQAQVEARLEDARRRLAGLRDERRAVNLEAVSLRRDRSHCSEELQFLLGLAEEEEQSLEIVHRANHFLEKAYQELEGHTGLLEEQRKELVQQVQKERELVRQDERGSAELRNRLEQLRRQQAAKAVGRQGEVLREQQIRLMQSSRLPPELMPSGHSWARVLAAPGAEAGPPAKGGGEQRPMASAAAPAPGRLGLFQVA